VVPIAYLSDDSGRSQASFSSLESYEGSSYSECGDGVCDDIGALLVSSKSSDGSSISKFYNDNSFLMYLLMYAYLFSWY